MRNIFKYGLLAMAIAVTSVGVRAQDIPVSGVVKDKSNNSTLPYASVIVKNESANRDNLADGSSSPDAHSWSSPPTWYIPRG